MNSAAAMIPGARPSTVPSRKSRRLMCVVPATRLMTVKGATGTMRTVTIARIPRRPSAWLSRSSRAPAIRRTAFRPARRPSP